MTVNASEAVDPTDPANVLDRTPHVYLTVDDDDENQVLELVKVDGERMFIRDHQQWVAIDPDADNERVWDRQIIDVTEEAAAAFDAAEITGEITVDQFSEYLVPEEPAE